MAQEIKGKAEAAAAAWVVWNADAEAKAAEAKVAAAAWVVWNAVAEAKAAEAKVAEAKVAAAAAKEWTFTDEIETWEAREEALEALKAKQIDETWNEFCTNYDLSPLCL